MTPQSWTVWHRQGDRWHALGTFKKQATAQRVAAGLSGQTRVLLAGEYPWVTREKQA